MYVCSITCDYTFTTLHSTYFHYTQTVAAIDWASAFLQLCAPSSKLPPIHAQLFDTYVWGIVAETYA